jgi:quercetin dioxygenase-like cupin family protein
MRIAIFYLEGKMFYKSTDENFKKILDGITVKTLVFGEKMLFSEFHMEQGSKLPLHSHAQEQTGRLLKGKISLSIGTDKTEIKPGDGWLVPGNVEHGADIVEESIAIEVFSPVREDYLQYYAKQ